MSSGRTKEYLSSNDIEFEDRDVDNDLEAARELDALGVPIPASGVRVLPITVIDGTRIVVGFDAPALKEALGIDAAAPRDLSAAELLEKYRTLYHGAKRAVLQIPEEKLDWATPKEERRGQTLRVHAFHLFDRADVCLDAAKTGLYTFEMAHQYERLAENYRTTRDIVEYADGVLRRIEDFLTHQAHLSDKSVDTFFAGPKTIGQLLNLALVGTALRIKQTYHFLKANGIEPRDTVAEEEFAGLAIPKKLFA